MIYHVCLLYDRSARALARPAVYESVGRANDPANLSHDEARKRAYLALDAVERSDPRALAMLVEAIGQLLAVGGQESLQEVAS